MGLGFALVVVRLVRNDDSTLALWQRSESARMAMTEESGGIGRAGGVSDGVREYADRQRGPLIAANCVLMMGRKRR
jgi:hypothetical protein